MLRRLPDQPRERDKRERCEHEEHDFARADLVDDDDEGA
jgi:hypothetical protein